MQPFGVMEASHKLEIKLYHFTTLRFSFPMTYNKANRTFSVNIEIRNHRVRKKIAIMS